MLLKYFIILFFISNSILDGVHSKNENNIYLKKYYDNGSIKSEGWSNEGFKTGYWKFYFKNGEKSEEGYFQSNQRKNYWYFYHENGKIKKEGHFLKGKKTDWWSFYNKNGKIIHKCQLNKGVKNGYCLKYNNEEISSAEKYKNGKKIKEWFSFSSFKKENKLSDLN